MANVLSTSMTNLVASPQVVNNRGLSQSEEYTYKEGLATTAANIANTNVILLKPLKWTDKIHRLTFHNTDLDSGGSALVMDIGLYKYQPRDGTYTVVDQDAYAVSSAIFASANLGGTNVAFSARTPDKMDKKVFEDGGLTAVPSDGTIPVLALTVTTAATTAAIGSIGVVIECT